MLVLEQRQQQRSVEAPSAAASPPSSCPSPLPQNLKGDPHRQAKVKTELCIHYARGKICPFGSRCNYARGEDELKYTKLFDVQFVLQLVAKPTNITLHLKYKTKTLLHGKTSVSEGFSKSA